MLTKQSKIRIANRALDAAYSFKWLYRTTDLLEILYVFGITIPLILSVILLGFDTFFPTLAVKLLSAVCISADIILILIKKPHSKMESYKSLANRYNALYNKFEAKYREENPNIKALEKELNELNRETSTYSTNILIKKIVDLSINKEMNLKWIHKAKAEEEEL